MGVIQVETVGPKGNAYYIKINGNSYGYVPIKMDLNMFEKTFKSMLKQSPIIAVNWAKSNGQLISKPKNNTNTVMENRIYEKDYSTEERKELAKKGWALPDGSFPIADKEDLKNAVHLIGMASQPAKAKSHIIKRAKELGASDLVPDKWVNESYETEVIESELYEFEKIPPFAEFMASQKEAEGAAQFGDPNAPLTKSDSANVVGQQEQNVANVTDAAAAPQQAAPQQVAQ